MIGEREREGLTVSLLVRKRKKKEKKPRKDLFISSLSLIRGFLGTKILWVCHPIFPTLCRVILRLQVDVPVSDVAAVSLLDALNHHPLDKKEWTTREGAIPTKSKERERGG